MLMAIKLCSTCHINPRRSSGDQNSCNECHAAWMRANRPTHSELTPEQRLKANARAYANVYQKRGILKPERCAKCGAVQAEKHHEDYAAPLFVVWLCRVCHLAMHRESEPIPTFHGEHCAALGAS